MSHMQDGHSLSHLNILLLMPWNIYGSTASLILNTTLEILVHFMLQLIYPFRELSSSIFI